jgi:hypothetical protein
MYNKPLLERIYVRPFSFLPRSHLTYSILQLAFAVLAVFILPVGLYQNISRSMTLNIEQEQTAKYFFEAKAITFAIFLGTILVFFAPLFFWRWFVSPIIALGYNSYPKQTPQGQRRMTALITSWAQSDRRASTSPPPSSPSGGGPPTWKCEVPGLFRSTARLTITIPRKSERSASAFGFYGDSYMSARDFDREVFGTMRSEKALAGGGPGKMGGRGTHDSYVGTINLFQPSPTRSAFGGPGAREKV